jgi:ABC-type sugar transport system substrate-binding protein
MNKFKAVIGIVLILGMSVTLFGCGTSSNNSQGGTAQSTQPSSSTSGKKLSFGYIAYNMKDVWNMYSAQAFQYAGQQLGVDTVVLDSENSLEKSVSLMQSLIQKKVDGISVFPISPDQAATLSKMANDAKIPITFENIKPAANAGNYVSVVAAEYDKIGEAAINFIAQTYPGAKVLFVAGAKGGGVYEQYQLGIDRALKTVGNKVSIVSTVHGDWETEKAMNVTQSFIQSRKDFNVVFANNELMAKGVQNALKDANLQGKVKVVSTGGGPDGLQMIQSGELTATMSAPVSLQGLITFKSLYGSLNGKQPEKFISLPIIPVSKETIDKAVSWKVDQKAVDFVGGLK